MDCVDTFVRRLVRAARAKCGMATAKRPRDNGSLAASPDLQDIVGLNLSRAVQIYVDLALHTLSSIEQTVPDTMGQAFDQLAQAGRIPGDLALRLHKAVGFRNVAVHSYSNSNIDWVIAIRHLNDFDAFARPMHQDAS